MSKRKRGDDIEGSDVTDAANFRKQRRIMAAFAESTKLLSRAFKLAKGLEQQKMGRRLKAAAAKKDEKDMDRITAEKTAIKALENTLCAHNYLAKSLLKIKAIAASPDLPAELSKPIVFPHDAASLNVHGRLCKANPVHEAFPAAMTAVKREFGIRDDDATGPVRKKRLRAKDYEGAGAKSEESGDGVRATKQSKSMKSADSSDVEFGSGQEQLDGSDKGSEDEFQRYQDRLASSDDEEDGGDEDMELSDIGDLERQLEQEGISKRHKVSKEQRYDPVADLSLSEDESEDDSIDEPPRKGAVAKANKSSFIPSLTMGGYISGSGSDIEDDVDVAPKKNRRGQRARQKIWEQKYKSKANHLKKQESNARWDPKRGAVGGTPRFAKGANSMPVENRRNNIGAAGAKKAAKKDDSGPLHPSWEAAKRAKEKNNAPVPFQGKKISFD